MWPVAGVARGPGGTVPDREVRKCHTQLPDWSASQSLDLVDPIRERVQCGDEPPPRSKRGGSYGPGVVGTKGTFGVTFTSRGEPGTGLVVTVDGEAVEDGLIAVESIEVSARSSVRVEVRPREGGTAEGPMVVEQEFPDLGFGETLEDQAEARLESSEGAEVRVWVTARAVEVGEARVRVRVMAMPNSAVAEQVCPVRTVVAGRRPLRFAAAHPCESLQNRALGDLGGTDTSFALIVLDEDDDVDSAGSKFRSLAESGFPDRSGWKSVLASLPHLHRFEALRDSGVYAPPPTLGGPPKSPTYGFALNRDSHDQRLGDDVVLPHVLLWEQGGQRDSRDRLTELIRSVVGRCELVQAVVTPTEVPPSLGINDRTPYEEMCGVGGPGLIGQAWTTRWLRWCAERTWIGASLVDHLEHKRAELEPFIAQRRAGVLELYAEDVDALEQVLDPILPAASDCAER